MKQFSYEEKLIWTRKFIYSNKSKITVLHLNWANRYSRYKSKGLKRMRSKKPICKRKVASITILNKNDLQIYQDIMEEILKDHGVSQEEFAEKVRQRKNQIKNKRQATNCLGVNRCSIYYSPYYRQVITNIDNQLLVFIKQKMVV